MIRRSISTTQRSGDDVGSAPALDHRRVHRRSPDERMLEVGQDLLDPQQEPRHRGDRAHAELRGGPVRRRAASGGGDPRAAALGEGEVQFGRLADDGRVLVEEAAFQQDLRPVQARRAPRRPRGADRAGRRARRRNGGSPRPRPGRSRWRPSCRPPLVRSAVHRRPRRRTADAATSRGRPRGRRRGDRSTRARAGRRSRTSRRRSAGPPRRGRSSGRRPARPGSPSRPRPRRPRSRPGSRSGSRRACGRTAAPRRGRPRRRRLETTASSTMAANVPERRAHAPGGQPRAAPRAEDRSGRTGSPRCCCRSSRATGSCSRGGRSTSRGTPGEISFPGGLAHDEDARPRRDRAARDAGGARALARGRRGARRAGAGPHVRLGDPDRAVRRRGRGIAGVRAQRGRDRRGPRATRSTSSRRPRPRSSGPATGTCTVGSPTRCATGTRSGAPPPRSCTS